MQGAGKAGRDLASDDYVLRKRGKISQLNNDGILLTVPTVIYFMSRIDHLPFLIPPRMDINDGKAIM
jgi:hypothetical protein